MIFYVGAAAAPAHQARRPTEIAVPTLRRRRLTFLHRQLSVESAPLL